MPFDTFELAAISDKHEFDTEQFKSNPCKVMIVLSMNEDKDLRENLLPKILHAVNLDIDKDAIVVTSNSKRIDIVNTITTLNINTVLVFGFLPSEVSLNLDAKKYKINYIGDKRFMFSDSLNIIASNKDRKLILWENLQTLFLS